MNVEGRTSKEKQWPPVFLNFVICTSFVIRHSSFVLRHFHSNLNALKESISSR